MAIVLNHTIVPAHDQRRSAEFFADIMGLKVTDSGHFDVVPINDQLTFDFADWFDMALHHYAFHVGDAEFDDIFGRIKEREMDYAADPGFAVGGEINHRNGGRGVYFHDLDGHVLELMTRT